MPITHSSKTGPNGSGADIRDGVRGDLFSLALAPLRQSLRLYAEMQRSALETFSRLGAMGTYPFVSAFGGSSDRIQKPSHQGNARVGPPAVDALMETLTGMEARTATPKPAASRAPAKRPAAAKPATAKPAKPATKPAKPATKPAKPAAKRAKQATKAAAKPAARKAATPAAKRSPKAAVKATGAKPTAAKKAASGPAKPRSTRARTVKKA